eukprot:CAMPEP_0178895030 /NCGR_PEP_ID=MMETSP0786-20121207/348_1 /TAXON_ID=186022 /ORGANISM="Thalassionema frauenfeldii, Strain CCMP 1798" /LENGTH=579 /DNA_ID=CAMNT_0020565191 /DNA_START=342 /DNA_END=2081 /DNA_ORIENTATION=+
MSLGGGNGESSMKSNNNNVVHCQLIMDELFQAIRIPWKTKVLGSSTNNIEGLSEFVLNEETGQIESHCIRSVTWNGQAMNGPSIGRALRATQSAVDNLQQSPLVQTFLSGSALLREGLLEQVATTASTARISKASRDVKSPDVIFVKDIEEVTGWIYETKNDTRIIVPETPFPGSAEWKKYASAFSRKEDFCEQVIPALTDGSSGSPDMDHLFDTNVTFWSVDRSRLMNGKSMVTNFFQSLALARRGTGGSWTLNNCSLVGWDNKTTLVRVDYQASLPPTWTIQGRDCYVLANGDDNDEDNVSTPLVLEIRQEKFSASDSSGSFILDNPWFMKNLVNALELQVGTVNPNVQDILSDLLLRQGSSRTMKWQITTNKKLSKSSAANVFYIMSDLHDSIEQILNETSTSPPAIDFMKDNVELVGYLDETLLRGSNVYRNVIGTAISTLQQAIAQKRVVVERNKVLVELTPKRDVRLSLSLMLRLSPPTIFPSADISAVGGGVPLQLDLISDYKIEPTTGFVYRHCFVATRVNGQLTPGDVISRWIQQFLKLDRAADTIREDDLQKSISETLAWLMRSSSGGF